MSRLDGRIVQNGIFNVICQQSLFGGEDTLPCGRFHCETSHGNQISYLVLGRPNLLPVPRYYPIASSGINTPVRCFIEQMYGRHDPLRANAQIHQHTSRLQQLQYRHILVDRSRLEISVCQHVGIHDGLGRGARGNVIKQVGRREDAEGGNARVYGEVTCEKRLRGALRALLSLLALFGRFGVVIVVHGFGNVDVGSVYIGRRLVVAVGKEVVGEFLVHLCDLLLDLVIFCGGRGGFN
mmetsp:Transcript_22205/g.46438  ORF Transcript_22205/g.46438 Transcript_22205/m.46438 type:complete len:238 (+) Transcript_22205:1149-1862(+)